MLGLGVEHKSLQHVVAALESECDALTGRIIETARNIPVRHIYRDNGFTLGDGGLWRLGCLDARPKPLAAAR